jgi:chromosome segregation ATPase
MARRSAETPRRTPSHAAAVAAIERAVDGATEELAVLHAEVAARDGELERLQEICDDRQRVIDELGDHAATYRRAAEERAGLVAALDFELQRLREDLERAEREKTAAISASEAAVLALDEERQRARMASGERDAELRAALREAEALRARAETLETALAARVSLIDELQSACDELQSACDERLTAIEQLSAEIASLRVIAAERGDLLEANEARYRARESELAARDDALVNDGIDWRNLAEDRERALNELAVEAERRSVLLAEVTAALEGRTREVEDLRKRLTRAS